MLFFIYCIRKGLISKFSVASTNSAILYLALSNYHTPSISYIQQKTSLQESWKYKILFLNSIAQNLRQLTTTVEKITNLPHRYKVVKHLRINDKPYYISRFAVCGFTNFLLQCYCSVILALSSFGEEKSQSAAENHKFVRHMCKDFKTIFRQFACFSWRHL